MHFVANRGTSSGVGCKPQSVLRALRLTILFTVLASAPCLAEDANNAGAGPVATVSMDHNTFIPGEITVVPGTSRDLGQQGSHAPHGGGYEQRVPIEDPRQGRQLLFHFCDRGRL
jgi:hypothetical protein